MDWSILRNVVINFVICSYCSCDHQGIESVHILQSLGPKPVPLHLYNINSYSNSQY